MVVIRVATADQLLAKSELILLSIGQTSLKLKGSMARRLLVSADVRHIVDSEQLARRRLDIQSFACPLLST